MRADPVTAVVVPSHVDRAGARVADARSPCTRVPTIARGAVCPPPGPPAAIDPRGAFVLRCLGLSLSRRRCDRRRCGWLRIDRSRRRSRRGSDHRGGRPARQKIVGDDSVLWASTRWQEVSRRIPVSERSTRFPGPHRMPRSAGLNTRVVRGACEVFAAERDGGDVVGAFAARGRHRHREAIPDRGLAHPHYGDRKRTARSLDGRSGGYRWLRGGRGWRRRRCPGDEVDQPADGREPKADPYADQRPLGRRPGAAAASAGDEPPRRRVAARVHRWRAERRAPRDGPRQHGRQDLPSKRPCDRSPHGSGRSRNQGETASPPHARVATTASPMPGRISVKSLLAHASCRSEFRRASVSWSRSPGARNPS